MKTISKTPTDYIIPAGVRKQHKVEKLRSFVFGLLIGGAVGDFLPLTEFLPILLAIK